MEAVSFLCSEKENTSDSHFTVNFRFHHEILEKESRYFIVASILAAWKRRYLLCYETVESNYQQKSPADRGNDEAKFVQVSDGSSV